MRYKICSDCGWRLREGHGDDRVRWFPLFGSYICGDCERNIAHRNIVRAVNSQRDRRTLENAPDWWVNNEDPAEKFRRTDPGTLELFSDYDEHGNTR